MVICLVVAVGGLFAQTKAPAQKAPAAPAASAAPASFDPALLQPATLTETAPDVYDVKFTTTKGDFVVRVTRAWAPLGADRFYNLVKHGFYDGAALFRVVPGFVVQFGISAHPQVSWVWLNATIKDDPVKKSNRRGYVTFATGGANTRTTQVFINLGDNSGLDATGFSPFGQVTEGMKVVEQLYSGYGEGVTDKQGQIASQGNAYLEKAYPKLDKIISATLVTPPEAPANAPAKKAP
jgi:peptidyl-prolyl cis-trans isomerase A (cyclophilin A)